MPETGEEMKNKPQETEEIIQCDHCKTVYPLTYDCDTTRQIKWLINRGRASMKSDILKKIDKEIKDAEDYQSQDTVTELGMNLTKGAIIQLEHLKDIIQQIDSQKQEKLK